MRLTRPAPSKATNPFEPRNVGMSSTFKRAISESSTFNALETLQSSMRIMMFVKRLGWRKHFFRPSAMVTRKLHTLMSSPWQAHVFEMLFSDVSQEAKKSSRREPEKPKPPLLDVLRAAQDHEHKQNKRQE